MRTRVRLARGWCLLLTLLLAVAGCGPGVGGTGTGEGYALEFFGAKKASVCSASFAGQLKCPSRIVIGPAKSATTDNDGSEPVVWVDDPAVAQVIVRISDSDVDLTSSCAAVRFAGTWGETAEGTRRFFGYFTSPGVEDATPGMLNVEAVRGGGLSYVLGDASGRIVFGPVVLRLADKELIPSSCSSVSTSPPSSATYR